MFEDCKKNCHFKSTPQILICLNEKIFNWFVLYYMTWANFWLLFIAGTTISKLSRGGFGVRLRVQQLSSYFSPSHTIVSRIIYLRLCYFPWLYGVTAMKSLTMKARAAAVCDPLCCSWQPNAEARQAKKCCWDVGWGFGVTAYLRDLLWCHL